MTTRETFKEKTAPPLVPEFSGLLNGGQSLLEVLVALSVIAVSVGAAVFLVFSSQSLTVDREAADRARSFAEEGLSAVRSIKDRNWYELTDGDHGLIFSTSTGQWSFAGSSDASGGLTRVVTISSVGTSTKSVKAAVNWQAEGGRLNKVELNTLLANWFEEAGGGGGATGGVSGDWRNPRTLSSVDIGPGNEGTDVVVKNSVVYLSGEASSVDKPDIFIFDVSSPAAPVLKSQLDIGIKGIRAVALMGQYLYGATTDDSKEFVVINVADPAGPALTASMNLSGSADAVGIFAVNNIVYLGRKNSGDKELYIIDVSSPAAPQTLSSFEVGSVVEDIYWFGGLAYLATSGEEELVIVNVSNPAAPALAGSFDAAGGSEDGKALTLVDPEHLYLGRTLGGNHTDHHELYVINAASTTSIISLGSKDIVADINDLIVVQNKLAFLATNESNSEFQIYDISDPANITFWSSFNFPQSATGIDFENNLVFVSVKSNDALRIITSSP